ncbi:MAG: hypothetical protein COA78_17795 [Blastopirellula sp.]|nr:MAG: hypothetical protein COA78_17795 [Blastopirellula sp.]
MISAHIIKGMLPGTNINSSWVVPLVQAIGSSGFEKQALALAKSMVDADFISIFCQGDRDIPLLVGTVCVHGQHRADMAAKGYKMHMSADKNTEYLLGMGGHGDFLTIQEENAIESFTYRRDCYERPGISARISLVRRTASYGLSISLYSSVESGPFPEAIYDRVAATLALILPITERHIAHRIKGTEWQRQDIQTRLALNFPDLTAREREVAAMTIKGRTAAEIGEILGLRKTTIITHRKKAYKRMNVKNLRQLIATFGVSSAN